MKQLVIGILAHVDSGKTTLSEGLLYRSGQIRKWGRVDHKDAFLDSFALERERGITIFSKQAMLQLPTATVTLLDTPGHVDFSTEMERTLQVLDYAILVISATDGVQIHTETLWQLLTRYRIPTILFINKLDLAPDDARETCMAQLKRRLSGNCVAFGTDTADEAFGEALALCDETLMEHFLETGRHDAPHITDAIARRTVFPCYFGAALKLEGIDALLAGITEYTRQPDASDAFGAKVFKITTDEQGTRLTYLKITGGSLKVRETLSGEDRAKQPWSEKANQLRVYSGKKFQSIEEAFPGTVCAVTGLTHTYPGQGLGTQPNAALPTLQPVLTCSVQLPPEIDAHTALLHLRKLEEEDPQLHVVWNEQLQALHVQSMGSIQLEILRSLLLERFQMAVTFGQSSILYLETIAHPVEGVGHFEPLRHYAEVHLLLEPGERGSGLCFTSSCREDALDKNWQRLILTHLEEKTHLGVLTGAPVTDMKITLAAGRAHQKHTEGGDFRQATYRAVRQGLKSAESILLEPWYSYRLEVPTELVGRALSDLQRMDAQFSPTESDGSMSVITGTAPVATLREYPMEVTAYTRGHGRISYAFSGYAPCHNSDEVIASIGYQSDSDLENPADSVFCAHGAGYTVKWDEVPKHMHLESVLVKSQEPQTAPKTAPVRHSFGGGDYGSMQSEEKELMAIYQRTYGPIQRDARAAFHTPKEAPPEPSYRAQDLPAGPEYLLVDGYNILFAWEDYKAVALKNIDAARHQLINLLCNYQGFRQCELILVFDAYKVKGNPGAVEQVHNIHVVYTKEAETADMYIEKVTHALGKKHRVRVATSDGLEQLIIMGHGALRVSATAFREEIELMQATLQQMLADQARTARALQAAPQPRASLQKTPPAPQKQPPRRSPPPKP